MDECPQPTVAPSTVIGYAPRLMSDAPIYLDNAATTRPFKSVVQAMSEVHYEQFGNPSSPHQFATQPKRLVEDARNFMRGSFCAGSLVLTSGGTEADLLGIIGAARMRAPGRILVGAADHPASLAIEDLASRFGHRTQSVPVSSFGALEAETLAQQLGPDVAVVSILHGHNELGSLCDLPALVEVIREKSPQAHIHVDLVQSYGKIAFDLDHAGVDSAAISAHKFHGPRGVGCLALANQAKIAAMQVGGGQEGGLRGGTENVAAVVGMARAAERVLSHLSESRTKLEGYRDSMFAAMHEACGAIRLGDPERCLPHILSMRVPGLRAETLQQCCDELGLAFSTGSACHGSNKDNHVLSAIGLKPPEAREVLRVSFSTDNTDAEIERATQTLTSEAKRLLHISPSPQ